MRNYQKIGQLLLILLVGLVITGLALPTDVMAKTTKAQVKKFTVVASAVGDGKITPQKAVVREGGHRLFRIIPKAGNKIADVKVDGQSVLAEVKISKKGSGAFTLTKVTADHKIEATFAKK